MNDPTPTEPTPYTDGHITDMWEIRMMRKSGIFEADPGRLLATIRDRDAKLTKAIEALRKIEPLSSILLTDASGIEKMKKLAVASSLAREALSSLRSPTDTTNE